LTTSGVTTPTIWVDLLIFVRELRFKSAAMQIEFNDIRDSECLLRQGSEKEFVDHACTRDANRTLLRAFRMGHHDHTTGDTLGSYRYLRAIVQTACNLTFRTLLELIRGEVQTRLDKRVIEDAVVFATRHKDKANQVGEDRPGAILAVEPQQGPLL
jgi:hypothetical protein